MLTAVSTMSIVHAALIPLKLPVTIVPVQHVIMKLCARHSEKRIKREPCSLLVFCGLVIYGNIIWKVMTMKKLLTCLAVLLMMCGCQKQDGNIVSEEKLAKYSSYYRTVLECESFEAASRYFDIYAEFHKAQDGTVIYYVYLDNAQVAMYDVEVIAVENMQPYQETDMMPTKGIFEDQKFSMIPYQYNVNAGYVKGFAISGDVEAEEVQLNIMVTWKDRARLNVSREFFEFNNLEAGAMGSHEGNETQIGEIIDAVEE